MAERKFAHRVLLDYFRRDKLRVQCLCGKQSRVFYPLHVADEDNFDPEVDDFIRTKILSREEQARDWYDRHAGVVEMKPQKRS